MSPNPAADIKSLIRRSAGGASRRMVQKATPANALRGRYAAPQDEGFGCIRAVDVFHVKQADVDEV
jgi:hypothetical protein